MQGTPVVATDGPRFEVLYGMPTVVRRAAVAAELTATLFVGGVQRSFVDNVMVQNGITIREGEWIRVDPATGLYTKASPLQAGAWPVWQDPGAGRFDAPVGGITFLQGHWTVATNMITDGFHDNELLPGTREFSVEGLRPGDELKVAVLPAEHRFAGMYGLAPINWDDGVFDPTNRIFCVAHVEQVFRTENVVVISNQAANYPVTVTQVLTTPIPTTAPPTTPAPTTAAPTTP